MTIRGIGVDILHLPRIFGLVARRGAEPFAKRILSSEELQEWCTSASRSLQFLAVRFCVKEAAYKALYPVARPTWKDLTYKSFGRSYPGSKPVLIYNSPSPPEVKGLGQIHVSVSHDGGYIFSTVVVENNE